MLPLTTVYSAVYLVFFLFLVKNAATTARTAANPATVHAIGDVASPVLTHCLYLSMDFLVPSKNLSIRTFILAVISINFSNALSTSFCVAFPSANTAFAVASAS